MSNDSLLTKIGFGGWVVWVTLVSAMAIYSRDWLLHYSTKPMIMGSFLVYVLFTPPTQTPLRGWLLGAVVLALVGDCCLMMEDNSLFLPGMVAMIGMMGCYIRIFIHGILQSGQRVGLGRYVAFGLPIAVVIWLYLQHLAGVFAGNPAYQGLWAPVVFYALVLGVLGLTGMLWQHCVAPGRFPVVGLGAILFMLATAFVSILIFEVPFQSSYVNYASLTAYALSQVFMIVGYISVYENVPVATSSNA